MAPLAEGAFKMVGTIVWNESTDGCDVGDTSHLRNSLPLINAGLLLPHFPRNIQLITVRRGMLN